MTCGRDVDLPSTDGPSDVSILRRDGCHLCDAVEAELRSMTATGLRVTVVNVDEDGGMQDRYGLRVPVATLRGKEVFEARMMDREGRWREKLADLLRTS